LIPYLAGITHSTIHRATKDGYKFLHGAAIIHHKGQLLANWANSSEERRGQLTHSNERYQNEPHSEIRE